MTHLPSSFEEERAEVLESVLRTLASTRANADQTAACRYLLRHLAYTGSVGFHAVEQEGEAGGHAGVAAEAEGVVGVGKLNDGEAQFVLWQGSGEFRGREPGGLLVSPAIQKMEHALV